MHGNVVELDVPQLMYTTDLIELSNLSMTSLMFPRLGSAKGITIANNPALTNVSMPKLTTIDEIWFWILNNYAWTAVNGFPLLESVYSVNITGNLSSVNFPSLNNVSHHFNISSTSTLNCSLIEEEAKKGGYYNNNFSCTALHPITASKSPSLFNSARSSLGTGAKAGIAVGSIVGFALICGGGIVWILRRRSATERAKTQQESAENAQIAELPAEKADAELEAKHGDSEMVGQGRASGFIEAFEMPAGDVGEINEHGRGRVDNDE